MVTSSGASTSSMNEAIGRYCSTTRELRFLSRKGFSNRTFCLKAAPCPGRPPTDSLSNVNRDFGERDNRASTEVLSADREVELAIAQCGASTRRLKLVKSEQTSATHCPLRRTSTLAPPPRSDDSPCPSKAFRGQQLFRANATESQAIRGHYATKPLAAVDSGDSTKITAEITVRSATSTEPKDTKLCVPTQSKLDTSDKSKEPRCSRLDPRHQYKGKKSTPTKRVHRAHLASMVSIRVEHIVGTDTKLLSSELQLQRDHRNLSKTSAMVSRGRSQSAGKPVKSSVATIDRNLSTADRRPRQGQHARTNAVTRKVKTLWHGKLNVEVKQKEAHFLNSIVPFQQKTNAQLIDFHLSTFNLKPPAHPAKTTRSEHTIPTYSKGGLCDLAYLAEFKSFTL